MNRTWDVIVLGVGGVGSAALYHLAAKGLRVLGVEQFELGHARGSSHGQTRIIRKAYFEHPDYVPLLKRSYELWDELQAAERRADLFVRCGLVQAGPPEGVVVPGVLASAERHGLAVESLSGEDLAKRFPAFRGSGQMAVVFEKDAGFLRVEGCVLAHVNQAKACGAEVLTGVKVEHWKAGAAGVELSTSEGPLGAGALVVAAGAWAPRLLAPLGLKMRVLRKQLYWLAARSGGHLAECGSPCFFYELPEGQFYGFPELEPGDGVKMACHTGGEEACDPEKVNRELDVVEAGKVRDFAASWLPEVSGEVLRHETCLYTMSPDEQFIIDCHPLQPNVCFAAGLSGHGFKFASVLGEVLADMAVDGRAELPVDFLSLRRFG